MKPQVNPKILPMKDININTTVKGQTFANEIFQ